MNGWNLLDLRKKETSPRPDTLVALYLSPTTARGQFAQAEHYQIGIFTPPDGGRKLYWKIYRTSADPTRMKRHYDIWWRYIPECNS